MCQDFDTHDRGNMKCVLSFCFSCWRIRHSKENVCPKRRQKSLLKPNTKTPYFGPRRSTDIIKMCMFGSIACVSNQDWSRCLLHFFSCSQRCMKTHTFVHQCEWNTHNHTFNLDMSLLPFMVGTWIYGQAGCNQNWKRCLRLKYQFFRACPAIKVKEVCMVILSFTSMYQ